MTKKFAPVHPGEILLTEFADWMKINGESIYGTSASPFQKIDWGRCTQKSLDGGKTRLYLHVFDWPSSGELKVTGAGEKVKSATLLAGRQRLSFSQNQGELRIEAPKAAPDANVSVIAIEVK